MADPALDPDRDLAEAAGRGDLDAFETLVRRYQVRMVSFARSVTGSESDAEDVAQEVFVRVFKALGRFRGESSFRTWLYTVAMNVGRTHRTRRLQQAPGLADGQAEDVFTLDPAEELADLETRVIARDAIARALDDLPVELRVAVTLRDVHGLDYKDIAVATGVPMGTVESRIFRARQRLRQALAPLRPGAAGAART